MKVKKILCKGLIVALFLFGTCANTKHIVKANMMTENINYSTKQITVEQTKVKQYLLNMGAKTSKASKVTVTSSNKKVVAAEGAQGIEYITMNAKKTGSATLTIKATVNGKVKTYLAKIKVVKQKNPFKKLQIGSTNLAKKATDYVVKYKGKTNADDKLNIKLKKGWKIKEIIMWYQKDDVTWGNKKIKNNTVISFPQKYDDYSFEITLKNNKKKEKHYVIEYTKYKHVYK